MDTELLRAEDDTDLMRAAELLRAGQIVAFPTETVYGLGARADDAEAVARLVRVKGRPGDKKFTLLIASPDEAGRWGELGPAGRALAARFWPGPLTMVVPDGRGGDVGLRCPGCDVTRELLRLAGTAIAAPSANLSSRPPATDAAEVLSVFDGRIAAVIDGGLARIGRPSTVVRLSGCEVEVLREGALATADVLAAAREAR